MPALCGFPSVAGLCSSSSAEDRSPLFATFSATTPASDCFASYIIGDGYSLPDTVPAYDSPGRTQKLSQVPVLDMHTCRNPLTPTEPDCDSPIAPHRGDAFRPGDCDTASVTPNKNPFGAHLTTTLHTPGTNASRSRARGDSAHGSWSDVGWLYPSPRGLSPALLHQLAWLFTCMGSSTPWRPDHELAGVAPSHGIAFDQSKSLGTPNGPFDSSLAPPAHPAADASQAASRRPAHGSRNDMSG